MRAALLTAARQPQDAPHAMLLCGRALHPDGFRLLQLAPVHLNAYAAARVRHALARAPDVDDADTLAVAFAYEAQPECEFPPELQPLANLCTRGGCGRARATALGLVWARSLDAAVRVAFPRPPHPFLLTAIRDQVQRTKRVL
jgi:hypothetical protein